jgi:hypothetical protein
MKKWPSRPQHSPRQRRFLWELARGPPAWRRRTRTGTNNSTRTDSAHSHPPHGAMPPWPSLQHPGTLGQPRHVPGGAGRPARPGPARRDAPGARCRRGRGRAKSRVWCCCWCGAARAFNNGLAAPNPTTGRSSPNPNRHRQVLRRRQAPAHAEGERERLDTSAPIMARGSHHSGPRPPERCPFLYFR